MTEGDLEAGISALERLRGTVDDAVLDLARSALIERLDSLRVGMLPERRLKQVSVLFVDTVGSTAMSARFDPETLQAIFDTTLARYTQLIQRHGGRVLQYAGDGLLAAFGTEQTREDDAERAVMAGLALIAETVRSAQQAQRQHGVEGFNVRVGIHTGAVLLGGGVDGENTIRGVTVSMAARMEQSAPPGRLRISQATRRMVQGLFEVSEQPPILVKGAAEPLVTWLVDRRLSRQAARRESGVGGMSAPMIGRGREFDALCAEWRVLHGGSPQARVTTVIGEAGLGKTRLLDEWIAWAQRQPDPVLWVAARARPATEHQPYELLLPLLQDLLQLPESETLAEARERFAAAVIARLDGEDRAEAQAHVLGYLLGMDFSASEHVAGIVQDGAQIRGRAFHTARQLLLRDAGQRPLVLLLEDLHWADAGSLQFLRDAVKLWPNGRLWLLVTARPSFDGRDPAWLGLETTRLLLQPLAPDQQTLLASALLKPLDDAPDALREVLVGRAAGNPYYMEQLLQMLLDRGALQVQPSGSEPALAKWRWHPERFDAQQLPEALDGVLQARLDLLPVAQRAALLWAAVAGQEFDIDTLRAVDPDASDAVPGLMHRQLLVPLQGSGSARTSRYAFAHQLMQAAAYARLLKPERQWAHARVGAWWVLQADAGDGEAWIAAADHYDRGKQGPSCARCSLQAAEYLASRFAHAEVVAQADRGLRLESPLASEARWRLLLARQRARRLLGDGAGQAQDLEAMAAVADATGSVVQLATVAVRRVGAADESGDSTQALKDASAALDLARSSNDPTLELTARYVWASALRRTGQYARSREGALEGLERAHQLGERRKASEFIAILASIEFEQSQPIASMRLLRQALAINRELGDQLQECYTHSNLGATALLLGDFASARADLEVALQLSRTVGRKGLEATALLNMAELCLAEGDAAAAATNSERAAELSRASGLADTLAFAHMSLGAACLASGDATRADSAYAVALQRLQALSLPHLAIEAVAGRAACAHLQRRDADAVELVEIVLAHIASTGHLDGTERPLRIRLTCYEILTRAQDRRARAVLQAAWDAFSQQMSGLPDDATRARFVSAHADHAGLCRYASALGLQRAG